MLPRLLMSLDGSHALALSGFDPAQPRNNHGEWSAEGAEHPYHVYPLQMKSGDGVKTMYAVQSHDNLMKGVKAGFGDTLHATEAEAHKHAVRQHIGGLERAAHLQRLEKEKADREAATKAKFDAVAGFTDGMTPRQTAKVVEHLSKPIRYNGKETTIKNLIESMVNEEGRKLESFEGKLALVHSDGRALTQKSIGKTGIDYAVHLLGER